MYLKSIEVHGFKSFANKLLFDFHDGITGIVGPNGSGKSNVADAVRWVLGEQSAKQLRGAKMEDVIFSGTEMRKPLSFAYVAITLDNSDHKLPIDYEEVVVARRVYRSGESEYLINGSACRLRDVQDLFLDTGIGQEGYSIIGQGQIDKILSGKPEERRELFDEAAGITKFKKRKNQAEKNLEAERLNLSRITDILGEIETRIGPLEKQSETAKKYLKLKDELKDFEILNFHEEYSKLQETRDQAEKNKEIAEGQLEENKALNEKLKSEYEALDSELEAKNAKIEEHTNTISESMLSQNTLEGNIKVLREQIIAAKQNDVHYKEKLDDANKSLKEKDKELDELFAEKEELKESDAKAKSDISALEKEISDLAESEKNGNDRLDLIREENIHNATRKIELSSFIEHMTEDLDKVKISKTAITQKVLKNKSDEAAVREELDKAVSKIAEIEKEAEKINASIDAAVSSEKTLKAEIEKVNADYQSKRQNVYREQSRLESLKNLAERYDGYGNSIKKVMEKKDSIKGIHGVVADLIEVKKSYETAVETALGASIQNIVTDTEDTAKKLIAYLKENKFGRATFLPLNAVSARDNSRVKEYLNEKGVIDVASGLVDTKDIYKDLVSSLLSGIVVVDNIDNAVALARKSRYSLRIVTVEGEQLVPGGAISGGAYKNSSNLLGRKREIEEIEERIAALNGECKDLSLKAEELGSELESQSKAVSLYKEELQKLYLEKNTYDVTKNAGEEKLKDVIAAYNEITLESGNLESRIENMDKDLKKAKDELEGLDKKNEDALSGTEKIKEEIAAIVKSLQEKKELLDNARLFAQSITGKLEFAQENINRVSREKDKINADLDELEKGKENSGKEVTDKEDEITFSETRIAGLDNLIKATEREKEKLIEERDKINESLKGFFAKREELTEIISGLDKDVYRLTGQVERIGEQLDTQINYMWEEYELTYGAVKEKIEFILSSREGADISASARKKRINDLKSSIKALGDVNVNAVEEFRELNERYTLLSTQKEDVVKAEEVLIGVIKELDELMRKEFSEKFELIRLQFDKVFKELFGGGKANLELMEEEDILEAGIRIIAQPPGKKLQNMMQLSGGEKALTAISLLFAIQNLKPSPFCLLDEIEAALDDSNVDRFARYLHKLTANTQFIVITHRRGTMNAADRLYGITMQEKGVSTLVSVNLIEDKLDK
ncbi:MAG: chromosome segregation protein SMC [Lachnospiraceae bacterium]|nr:chromosome segregation protein SMC [Lachnospiraceae bacterium]